MARHCLSGIFLLLCMVSLAHAEGTQTASGDTFDKTAMTAAHRTLPLYSQARVTNVANGRSVTVLVTDRGPTSRDRIIDLSESAAMQIGMRHRGIARVRVEPILASAE